MAISIDATVGGASANSYITLSDANAIVEGLVADDDVAAWDGSNTDNKNRALYTAAVRVDRERFLGARVTNTQALQWPRQGVRKPDTYINTYSIGFRLEYQQIILQKQRYQNKYKRHKSFLLFT